MIERLAASMRATCAVLLVALLPAPAAAQAGPGDSQAENVVSAVVRIRMKALPDARTAAYLGDEREGSGVVADEKGHIVTIGYLVIEAASIEVTTAAGRSVPVTLAGFDPATGLGVLRPAAPLEVRPIAIGTSAKVAEGDPVMVLPYGGRQAASLAFVVSRRPFAGSWEYLLESAIYTTPPAERWSGSALIDRDGRLVGIGSLLLRDAAEAEHAVPGNLFVPIDLLRPILPDLIAKGRAPGPPRAWLGLTTDELRGRLFVSRLSPEGPAERGGLKSGDIILAVGGSPVEGQADFYRKVWALGPAGTEVPLQVLQGSALRELKLRSIDRLDYLRKPPAY